MPVAAHILVVLLPPRLDLAFQRLGREAQGLREELRQGLLTNPEIRVGGGDAKSGLFLNHGPRLLVWG